MYFTSSAVVASNCGCCRALNTVLKHVTLSDDLPMPSFSQTLTVTVTKTSAERTYMLARLVGRDLAVVDSAGRTSNNALTSWNLSLKQTKNIYTVSQKKLCQLIFCSFSVKHEPISIKIGRIVPKETLNKTVSRAPTSPKYVLALLWEI